MDKRFAALAVSTAIWWFAASAAHAQQTTTAADITPGDAGSLDVRDMDTVVVTGMQPGPGLWRARRADGHTLHILGTQSPLPADITWRADEVREVLARAGIALGPPGVQVGAEIGFFRGLTLAPAAFRAMRNPDGATLDMLLPPELYVRWARLKQRYIGRDRGIERKRPFIAVYQLYREALKQNGLREGGVVGPVIEEALAARGLKVTPTVQKLQIDDPRGALAAFRRETLKPEDIECVRGTLDIIENDLPRITTRANAWAVGDLEALRAMPDARAQVMACLSAWTASETARDLGMADIESKVDAAWLAAVDAAMAAHEIAFATVPIDTLLRTGGLVDGLRARGYTVAAPDAVDALDDEDAAGAEMR